VTLEHCCDVTAVGPCLTRDLAHSRGTVGTAMAQRLVGELTEQSTACCATTCSLGVDLTQQFVWE
jgi:hypothetical protein